MASPERREVWEFDGFLFNPNQHPQLQRISHWFRMRRFSHGDASPHERAANNIIALFRCLLFFQDFRFSNTQEWWDRVSDAYVHDAETRDIRGLVLLFDKARTAFRRSSRSHGELQSQPPNLVSFLVDQWSQLFRYSGAMRSAVGEESSDQSWNTAFAEWRSLLLADSVLFDRTRRDLRPTASLEPPDRRPTSASSSTKRARDSINGNDTKRLRMSSPITIPTEEKEHWTAGAALKHPTNSSATNNFEIDSGEHELIAAGVTIRGLANARLGRNTFERSGGAVLTPTSSDGHYISGQPTRDTDHEVETGLDITEASPFSQVLSHLEVRLGSIEDAVARLQDTARTDNAGRDATTPPDFKDMVENIEAKLNDVAVSRVSDRLRTVEELSKLFEEIKRVESAIMELKTNSNKVDGSLTALQAGDWESLPGLENKWQSTLKNLEDSLTSKFQALLDMTLETRLKGQANVVAEQWEKTQSPTRPSSTAADDLAQLRTQIEEHGKSFGWMKTQLQSVTESGAKREERLNKISARTAQLEAKARTLEESQNEERTWTRAKVTDLESTHENTPGGEARPRASQTTELHLLYNVLNTQESRLAKLEQQIISQDALMAQNNFLSNEVRVLKEQLQLSKNRGDVLENQLAETEATLGNAKSLYHRM